MDNSLKDIQQRFFENIFENNQNIKSDITENKISFDAKLQIYRNNIFSGLSNSLKNIYPAIIKLVGDEYFEYLARQYILANPSKSGNLDDYGLDFGQFISKIDQLNSFPYLKDVAKLEWNNHIAYFATDSNKFDIGTIAEISNEKHSEIIFDVSPSLVLLKSDYAIDKIYHYAKHAKDEQNPNFDINSTNTMIITYRPNFEVINLNLEQDEYDFIVMLKNKKKLQDISSSQVIDTNKLGYMINNFIENEVICGFSF